MLTLGLALALVAQDAPAPPVKDPVYYSITLPNLEGTKAESKSESMKIGSFRWGSEGTDGSPAPQGTIIVKVEYPWSSCQVGANYPSLALAGGAVVHVPLGVDEPVLTRILEAVLRVSQEGRSC